LKSNPSNNDEQVNMKNTMRPLIPLAIASLALMPSLNAHAEKNHFYVEADAGAAFTVDTELKEWFGAPIPPNSTISFDPGFRLGLRGGYGVTDWFDAELETGITANEISSVSGATQTEGSLANIPLLLNARFHCPAFHRLSPYFGGGLGLSSTILYGDNLTIGGTSLDGSIGGVVFAYQAFAGLRYEINEHMGLALEYHYFATTDSTMSADVTIGTVSDEVKLGGTATHAVTIAFDYKF
jgi:opacity protein-like surface antigen